jgi:hypothetical protein
VSSDQRIDTARRLYDRSVFFGDSGALAAAQRELDLTEADLAVARGKIMHGRFLEERAADASTAVENPDELPLFERAAELYRVLGEAGGEAETQFWIGCLHQVIRRDAAAAAPYLDRSCELAALAGDELIRSDALRLIAIAEHRAGDLTAAQARLEESTQLRRDLGFAPGVASNLVGLAYMAASQGRPAEARSRLDEAAVIAAACAAEGIMRQVREARGELAGAPA